MQLSLETLSILKNFSSINQAIHVKPGNSLKTIKGSKTVLAEAIISERFEKEFAIYNLNQFLNGVNLLGNPELEFKNDSYMTLSSGKQKIKYFYAQPSVILSPPDKKLSLPSEDIKFSLDHSCLDKIIKAKQIYELEDLSIVGDGKIIQLLVRDKANDTSNVFTIDVGETKETFCMNLKIENLNLFQGSYDVIVSKRNISKFTHKTISLFYWIAMEPDSTFE